MCLNTYLVLVSLLFLISFIITNMCQGELRGCLTSVSLVFYQSLKGIIILLAWCISICSLPPQNQSSKQSNNNKFSKTRSHGLIWGLNWDPTFSDYLSEGPHPLLPVFSQYILGKFLLQSFQVEVTLILLPRWLY